MTLEELKYIIKEICTEHGSYGCKWIDQDYLPEQLTLVEEGDIEDGGKYQHQSDVYKDDQGNHFMIHNSRSGSYYTDYEPGEPSVAQVKPVVETITRVVWKAV
jgi:hypothetical protein